MLPTSILTIYKSQVSAVVTVMERKWLNKIIIRTRKRDSCECIATWGHPSHASWTFPALITTPCQVWSRWTYPLPCYSIFAADTLLYAVILTFDLWPWTFAVYRLWCDETLCQIWTQSSNPQWSYCDFSVRPYDLEHCVTCCAWLWDNFHQVWALSAYLFLNCSVFYADMLLHAVTLTFNLLTLKFYSTLGVLCLNSIQNLTKIV